MCTKQVVDFRLEEKTTIRESFSIARQQGASATLNKNISVFSRCATFYFKRKSLFTNSIDIHTGSTDFSRKSSVKKNNLTIDGMIKLLTEIF
jgi:hypothetical protein